MKNGTEEILNNKNISEKFEKIMTIYYVMTVRDTENEINLKIKIKQKNTNKNNYFLDNTQESDGDKYFENGKYINHKHDNLKEMNKNNMTLFIE